jgi:hypothetical protein
MGLRKLKRSKAVEVRREDSGRGGSHLRPFRLPQGMPPLPQLVGEIQGYWDVLLGRVPPPVPINKVEAMMEVADAYYARAQEITAMIQLAEQAGRLPRGSEYSKFRTGALRTFAEVAKKASELGSRRITVRGQQIESERTGRDRITT